MLRPRVMNWRQPRAVIDAAAQRLIGAKRSYAMKCAGSVSKGRILARH